ncbi:MAG: dual specificity protein phosphatase family protein [Thermodesulfobacteriota bacterium]
MSGLYTFKSLNNFRWIYARILFYPTLVFNMFLSRVIGIRNWWDQVDEYVILGALPTQSDIPKLKNMGIKAVLNVCEEHAGHKEAYFAAGIEQLRLPTIDYTMPSLKTVQRGVEFIDSCVARGQKVYVHCKAGRGRSAAIVLCWLMKSKKLSAQSAMEFLLSRRPHINNQIYKRKVVSEFIEKRF